MFNFIMEEKKVKTLKDAQQTAARKKYMALLDDEDESDTKQKWNVIINTDCDIKI